MSNVLPLILQVAECVCVLASRLSPPLPLSVFSSHLSCLLLASKARALGHTLGKDRLETHMARAVQGSELGSTARHSLLTALARALLFTVRHTYGN